MKHHLHPASIQARHSRKVMVAVSPPTVAPWEASSDEWDIGSWLFNRDPYVFHCSLGFQRFKVPESTQKLALLLNTYSLHIYYLPPLCKWVLFSNGNMFVSFNVQSCFFGVPFHHGESPRSTGSPRDPQVQRQFPGHDLPKPKATPGSLIDSIDTQNIPK